MSKTSIEWTTGDDGTPGMVWNPVVGCTKISPGCKNCYAKATHDRRHKGKLNGANLPNQYDQPFEVIQQMPDRLSDPLRWRKPRRIFVNSVSDLFHEDVPYDFIVRVLDVMHECPQHTFQVLTKRAPRMLKVMQSYTVGIPTNLPPNLWLGVSVEDQKRADERIPLLLKTPAAVRFLSCEPLLGEVDLEANRMGVRPFREEPWLGVDWVIVGGESGIGCRPCHVERIRSVVQQCKAAGVPCFVKQLGGNVRWNGIQGGFGNGPSNVWPQGTKTQEEPGEWRVVLKDSKGGNPEEWPEDLRVREFPAADRAKAVQS